MQITNFTPAEIRFRCLTDKNGPIHPIHGQCWQWKGWRTGKSKRAYIKVNGTTWIAARFLWTMINGSIPDGLWVLHKCDNVLCVNPSHLFLGTRLDNIRDMLVKDRHSKGETNRHKLTDLEAEWVCKVYTPRHPVYGSIALSKKLSVSRCQIERIAAGRSRRSLAMLHKPQIVHAGGVADKPAEQPFAIGGGR